jgi:hypothetical protein
MKIPMQAFAQVVAALQRPGAGGDGREKRTATRMNIETPLTLTLLATSKGPRAIQAISRDISQSGIGLVLGTATKTGDRIVVHLPRTPQPAMLMLAVVKLCKEVCDGVFKVGVEFVKELTEDELNNLKASGAEIERIQRSILTAT